MAAPVVYKSKRIEKGDDPLQKIDEIVMITIVTLIGHLLMTTLTKKTADIIGRNELNNRGWKYATYWSSFIQALIVIGLVSMTYNGCKPPP